MEIFLSEWPRKVGPENLGMVFFKPFLLINFNLNPSLYRQSVPTFFREQIFLWNQISFGDYNFLGEQFFLGA